MLDEDRYLIFFNVMNWRIIKSVKMKVMTVEISRGVCVCVCVYVCVCVNVCVWFKNCNFTTLNLTE